MSFRNIAWASEQSGVVPSAKLLAIFIASNADILGRSRFAVQDAASWCCFARNETAERLTYMLANECGLQIIKTNSEHDILTFEVQIPAPKNGGELL
jgi:hypothetical protein